MSMVERVARALCKHGEPTCWETHVGDARDAIEAMKKPPKAMKRRAMRAVDKIEAKRGYFDFGDEYAAMIDAALK